MKALYIIFLVSFGFALFGQDINGVVSNASQSGMCSDGSIDITMNGGYPPYTFEWSNGETTEDISNLSNGDYTLLVSDAICSNAEINFSVECNCDENCELEAEVEDSTCENFGVIRPTLNCYYFNPSEYQIEWSDGIIGRGWDRGGLMPGEYCLTVTDPNDCSYSNCWNVGGADGMFDAEIISFNNVDECDSEMPCNGSIDIEIIQGNGIFTYNWSNGSNAQDLTNVCDGDYSVTVTDQNGCTEILSASLCCCTTIEYIPELNFSSNVAGNCYGDGVESIINPPLLRSGSEVLNQLPNASISTRVRGGTGNYSCQWIDPNGQIISYSCNSGLTGLTEPGEYCFIVEDGCNEIEDCITILDCNLNPVQISAEVNNNCYRFDAAGSISVIATGGNGPYTYSWTNGASGNFIQNLSPNIYCLTVTDSNNCSESFCATINTGYVDYSYREECVTYGVCNNQTRIIDSDPIFTRINPEDCRYEQRFCFNDGDFEVVEETYIGTYFGSGAGCLLYEKCNLNNSTYETHYGVTDSYSEYGYDQSSNCWYCWDVEYCYYPTGPEDEISDLKFTSRLGIKYQNGCEEGGCWVTVLCNGSELYRECHTPCYDEYECRTPNGLSQAAFTYTQDTTFNILEDGNIEKHISYNVELVDTSILMQYIKDKKLKKQINRSSDIQNLIKSSPSINKINDNFIIYPNPATSELNIKLIAENESQTNFQKIEVIDISGKVLITKNINLINNRTIIINIDKVPSGFYGLRH